MAPNPPAEQPSLRVLIVDDNPDVLATLVPQVQRLGHVAETASDARAALERSRPGSSTPSSRTS